MTLWTYWPGPFHWPDSQKDGFTVGVEETGGAVCVVPNEQMAKRIVTAVNSHEDMQGKLEQAGAVIGSLLRAFSGLTQIPLNNMEYAKLEYYFTSDDPYDPDLNVPELAKVRIQA